MDKLTAKRTLICIPGNAKADELEIPVPIRAAALYGVLHQHFGKPVSFEELSEKLERSKNVVKVHKHNLSRALADTHVEVVVHRKTGYMLRFRE